jgi:lipid-A-disaccharide synthase-like uncharacterized protein
VVTLDADLQNNPADIPELVRRLEGNDAVLGVWRGGGDSSPPGLVRVANAVRRVATGDGFIDVAARSRPSGASTSRPAPLNGPLLSARCSSGVAGGSRFRWATACAGPGRPYNLRNRARTLLDLLAMRRAALAMVHYDREMNELWLAIGFGGQLLFTSRFLVQWIASERRRQSIIPTAFWWLSLGGASLLLAYAIWRRDPVFILGQAFGFVVYTRNLILIARRYPAVLPPPEKP